MKKRGFSIIEAMISVFIATYVFLGAFAMYEMGWKWWYEILPQTECQRIARIAISVVSEGLLDSTAGTDTINSITYKRRTGAEWTSRTSADVNNATFVTPTISADKHKIYFKLEPDPTASNTRSFYLGQYSATLKALYYQYSNNTAKVIRGTEGLTDLTFETVAGYSNLIKVTATAQKTVVGSRKIPYQISVVYTDFIYLRNI